MEYIKENDFFKDINGPTEQYVYSHYLFWQDSQSEWGRDYDQFVFVENAYIPYIRKVEKRGQCMTPCGGSPFPSTDGRFARKTPEERDTECPKIAFGVVASFLINLRYDNNQKDFVPLKEISCIMREYYNRFRDSYMSKHNGLKFQDMSYDEKELDFVEIHKKQELEAWERSSLLKGYSLLYEYAYRFHDDYMTFIERIESQLKRKLMPNKIRYSIRKSKAFDSEYLKVFLLDNGDIQNIQTLLSSIPSIRKINISNSVSSDHPCENLTVYPKSMCTCEEVETQIKAALDKYQSNVNVGQLEKDSTAHFKEIETQILSELDNAHAMIDVCVAWFTNDKLRDKLFEKLQEGVAVRIITFHDGVNKVYGVDLTEFEHIELRGEHGGIMHDKFCIIDNVTTITGSYNWTTNAEFKNDENIAIQKNDVEFASKYTRQFNEMWKRSK